jgi:hypothetical protein
MTIPKFTAEQALYKSSGYYRHGQPAGSHADTVVPAIPFCGNCDYILDRCARNGFRPRALCWACLTGNCFSGVENPPPVLQNPVAPFPLQL